MNYRKAIAGAGIVLSTYCAPVPIPVGYLQNRNQIKHDKTVVMGDVVYEKRNKHSYDIFLEDNFTGEKVRVRFDDTQFNLNDVDNKINKGDYVSVDVEGLSGNRKALKLSQIGKEEIK